MCKCSYCGKDRLGNTGLKDGNNQFCDNKCRYSFDKNGGKHKNGVEIEQTPVQREKTTSQKKTAITFGVIVPVIIAALVGIFTNSCMILDSSRLSLYTSPDNSFCVMFPKKVDMQVEAPEKLLGLPILCYMFNANSKYHAFTISFSEIPKPFVMDTDPKTILDNLRDRIVRSIQGQLLSETLFDMSGNPGRELRIEGPQKIVFMSRIYFAKNRIYQIMVGSEPGHEVDKIINTVFESFKITGLTKTGTQIKNMNTISKIKSDTINKIIEKKSSSDIHVGLITVENFNDAVTVKQTISNGITFEEVAKKYSQGPNAKIGGDIGYVNPKDLDKKIADKVLGLKENEISDIIKTDNGYIVVKRIK